jgi:lipoyl synthase
VAEGCGGRATSIYLTFTLKVEATELKGFGLSRGGRLLQAKLSTAPLNFIRGRKKRGDVTPREPKPAWLKVRAPGSENYHRLKGLMRGLGLHTVCEEANCPNIGECWHHGTATFMILGDTCTRSCGYCNVTHGKPNAPDVEEPVKVAKAIQTLDLDYIVVTSVDRDDLDDGGASHFAKTIEETRTRAPRCRIEVLIPDFKGEATSLYTVLDARPDVLNHNIETVPRLYRTVRPGGRYERALQLLERSRTYAADIPTKSGLMVGLGEEWDEVVSTLEDLRSVGCQIVTIGQYLRPSLANVPMSRYYTPSEFTELKRIGLEMGIGHVESGPLVRSSYHAHEQTEAFESRRAAPDSSLFDASAHA